MQNFRIENSKYGKRLIPTSSWNENIIEVVNQNNIQELYLNYAHGWKGTDLKFLRALSTLKAFTIIDWTINDVSDVHNLQELEYLEIGTYCKTAINFNQFPKLKVCRFEWRPKSETLFACSTLSELFLNRYKGKKSDIFTNLTDLHTLSIANSALEEVSHIRVLQQLEFLGLYELKMLHSLDGIEELLHLKSLEVSGCTKIKSLKPIENLINLTKLHVINDGKIDSISPVKNLLQLEELIFYESTNIVDGDLTYLLKLGRLKNIAFQNRRHYTHSREALTNLLNNKEIN